jgi:hypothetical protein
MPLTGQHLDSGWHLVGLPPLDGKFQQPSLYFQLTIDGRNLQPSGVSRFDETCYFLICNLSS